MRLPESVSRAACPLVLVSLILAPGVLPAQETGAEEGRSFSSFRSGRRGLAWPGNDRARHGGGCVWNPAGLAQQGRRTVMVYRGASSGDATALSVLLPWGSGWAPSALLPVARHRRIRLCATSSRQRAGRISVRNQAALVSYAAAFPGRIYAGINVKLVQFRIACRGQCPDLDTTSSAYAIDAGIQAEPFRRIPLRFGGMIAHAGTEFQVINEEQSDPLPTRVRFAVAYDVLRHLEEDGLALWLTLETEDRARDPGSPSLYTGLNLSAADLFYVRAGYVGGKLDQTNGASVGLGFRIDRFYLNLAKSLTRSAVTGASQPLHVTFGVAF